MVVAEEGGRCVCPSCHVSCPGQFSGCASVTSRPGYVPDNAPSWARPPAPPAELQGAGAGASQLVPVADRRRDAASGAPFAPAGATAADLVAALESLLLPSAPPPPPEPLTVTLAGIRAEIAELRRLLAPPRRDSPPAGSGADAALVAGLPSNPSGDRVIDLTQATRGTRQEDETHRD